MYCRQCGGHVSRGVDFCTNCGFRPLNGNAYCQDCGVPTKPNQEMCVNCHRQLVSMKGTEYAGFWLRFAAYTIDGVILTIPMMILGFFGIFIGAMYVEVTNPYMNPYEYDSIMNMVVMIAYVIGGLLSILYFAGMHASKWQGTIGKKVVGIKIINEKGGRISFLKGVGRYFALFISTIIFYIGFIMAGFTSKKQALHDMITKTLVVRIKS